MQIGIDLGGSKIELCALRRGQPCFQKRVPTPAHDYDAIVGALSALVLEAEQAVGESGSIGIATPGALSRATGALKNSNTVCLNGRPLDRDLAARLGRPVRIENDANCFALSEAIDGAAQGAEVVFGVIVGTGVGGGVVVRQQVLHGRNAIAGEWGHNPLPWPLDAERPGPACYCGKHGCIETFLSGPGLARDHAAGGVVTLQAQAIARAADSGDAGAAATLQRFADRLARALATVINVIDPDVIVLGGGVSNIDMLYDAVPRLWSKYVFSDRVDTVLTKAKHGDASGVRGAAWLWPAV